MKRGIAEQSLINKYVQKIISEITVETNGDFVCEDCNMILHNCKYLISEVLWEFYDEA